MANETPELPIQWSLPGGPTPRYVRPLFLLMAVVWLVTFIQNGLRGEWRENLFPAMFLLLCLMHATLPRDTKREYEVTYAAASSLPRLLSRHGVEWPHVRLVNYGEDRIELRRHRWFSPVVLELPPDPDLRARIVAAIRAKTARYVDRA